MKTTYILMLLCVFTSLFFWYVSPEFVERFIVFKAHDFLKGAFWTPITALFVHENLVHLSGNMVFLYVFGKTLDDLSPWKTATVFFIGGIISFILSASYYGLDVIMVGASAAIFSLTGVVMLTKPMKFSWFFLMPLGLVAILYFLYNLLAIYYAIQGNVGYVAHVIGFIIGLVFGVKWSRGQWIRNLYFTVLLLVMYFVLMLVISAFSVLV